MVEDKGAHFRIAGDATQGQGQASTSSVDANTWLSFVCDADLQVHDPAPERLAFDN
jgi:hypothetical protein